MRIAWNLGAAAADEEVEIRPQMRLLHMLDIEFVPPALGHRRRSLLAAPSCEFLIGYVQMQTARGHVELDEVPVAHQYQRPTLGSLRRDMQHHCAVRCSAHARIGHPHHVGHALLQELGGKIMLPTSAIPGYPFGPQFFRTITQVSSVSSALSSIRA